MARLENYLVVDEGVKEWATAAQSLLGGLKNKTSGALATLSKKYWNRLVNILQANQLEKDALVIINRRFGTRYRSLDQITVAKIAKMSIQEDISHWWKLVTFEGFPVLTFYPALQVFFELDNLLRGTDVDLTRVIVYGALWAFLVSGKYIKSWNTWRKQNPGEYEIQKGGKKTKLLVKRVA